MPGGDSAGLGGEARVGGGVAVIQFFKEIPRPVLVRQDLLPVPAAARPSLLPAGLVLGPAPTAAYLIWFLHFHPLCLTLQPSMLTYMLNQVE